MESRRIIDIPLFEASPRQRRREPREAVARRVDFARFPRVCAERGLRRGLTHDLSTGGLCLRTEQAEPVGALLKLTVHDEDGRPGAERIGRVAWTRPTGAGEHRMGIALLPDAGTGPIRIRYRVRPEAA